MNRHARSLVLPGLLALAVLLLGACSGAPAATPSPTASPVDYDAEAQAAADLLDQALAAYIAGDSQAAMDLVADAYEQHFELIEHPLEEIDEAFMEELEVLIATRIRAAMTDGAPASTVQLLVEEAKAGLAQAQEMLE